ncbi:MAG: hypothetical protein OEY14_07175 [Myxococcales bacterium]|nr:hypothetical protein [Myxococcales bacterium]
MTRYARRFRRIARSLSGVELMDRPMDEALSFEDIDPTRKHDDRRFLDYYGEQGVKLALKRYGIFAVLERRGYGDFDLTIRNERDRHSLFLRAHAPGLSEPSTLVELVVRRDLLVPDGSPAAPGLAARLESLTVDWLSLRHPLARFDEGRPRLPGQDAPGLRIGERVMEMLYRVVERLRLDTLATVPAYFHNAHLYARELPYLDPWYAGQLQALERLLLVEHELSLAQASWAIEWGLVSRETDEPLQWRGQLMLWPHDERLDRYFGSSPYRREVERVRDHLRHRLDRAAFDARWAREAPTLIGGAR